MDVVPHDPHSYARPEEARVTNVALDLTADFTARRLVGRVSLTLERSPSSEAVVLDTRDLTIRAVTDDQGRQLPFSLGRHDPILGRALEIVLPPGPTRIDVRYETAPGRQTMS